jgi:hypothetical protein
MPLVFRAMKKDDDGLPVVEQSASGLGIRPGVDADLDAQDNVIANGKGMSVSPGWRVMPITRIPKRLRTIVRGARGSNRTSCFRFGDGQFLGGPLAKGLELVPDTPTHGCIAPMATVPLAQYESDLAATRSGWQVDES